jgi:hypothetical protein
VGLTSAIRLLIQRPRPTVSAAVANWNSGVATSGQPGGNLFVVGQANVWMRLVECFVLIGGLTPGATITLRGYRTAIGAERLWGDEDYVVGVDLDLVWQWGWWNLELLGTYRLEAYSDNALDDGASIPYEYSVKGW